MVRQQHGLRVLEVGVAGQDHVEVSLRRLEQCLAQGQIGGHEIACALLHVQARVGGHLIVARTPRVQPRPGVANGLGEHALHGHVDVLVVYIELELALVDDRLDGVKPLRDGRCVVIADDALGRQHVRMGDRTGDVLGVQPFIHGKGRAEPLRERICALFESS